MGARRQRSRRTRPRPRARAKRSSGVVPGFTHGSTRFSTQLLARWTAVAIVCAIIASATACSSSSDRKTSPQSTKSPAGGSHPNIVFVLADDLDSALLTQNSADFPNLRALAKSGATFSNYFVSDSLCCPSRATTLRGQYDHNTGVLGNALPHGGYETFHDRGDEKSTIATWLQAAGYRTGLFGKYLNGYPNTVSKTFVPPGWNEWVSPSQPGAAPYNEYDVNMNVNGHQQHYGHSPSDYLDDVFSDKSTQFMRKEAGQHPFFAYIAPYAPHNPATPPPRHAGTARNVSLPRPASFDEADVSDKPQFLRNAKKHTQIELDAMVSLYRLRIESMRAVDDLIGNVVKTLRSTGQLSNTYIAFTSDNGFHFGQHRLGAGKLTGYEEDIHVPLYMSGPKVPAGHTVGAQVVNTDLAPTFAALAGADAPDFVDGRSFAPLLRAGAASGKRQAFLLEHYDYDLGAYGSPASYSLAPGPAPAVRNRGPRTAAVPFDPDAPPPPKPGLSAFQKAQVSILIAFVRAYLGVRTTHYTYIEWANGERELYDLRTDRAELNNLASTAPASLQRSLHKLLESLRTCRAASCRQAEDASTPS